MKNFYQNETGQVACIPCPPGKATESTGAISTELCYGESMFCVDPITSPVLICHGEPEPMFCVDPINKSSAGLNYGVPTFCVHSMNTSNEDFTYGEPEPMLSVVPISMYSADLS